ncbi:MAG: GntR family transcriptional regulator [Armatimonadia bacterium]|nr:GntR family transcriptional regulator [Armatimonadia bacterium]
MARDAHSRRPSIPAETPVRERLATSTPLKRPRLSDQVASSLRDKIASGELIPGERLPSERELSTLYDVSVPVFREAAALLVRENLIERHQGRGSFVREDALEWLGESPPLQGTLGVVATWTEGEVYFGQVFDALSRAMAEDRWAFQVIRAPEAGVPEAAALSGADGVIWLERLPDDDPAAALDLLPRTPVVLYNRLPSNGGPMAVRTDERGGSSEITRHLARGGCTSLVAVAHFADRSPYAERLEACAGAAANTGLALSVIEIGGYVPSDAERDEFRAKVAEADGVYFLAGDLLRQFGPQLARRAHRIPAELRVAVFDDFPYLQTWERPIVAVRQPLELMAQQAVTMLSEALHGLPVKPMDRIFAPDLVMRGAAVE